MIDLIIMADKYNECIELGTIHIRVVFSDPKSIYCDYKTNSAMLFA